MSVSTTTPVSHTETEQFEPYLSSGQAFGEVHWLRKEVSGDRALYTGLWKHECATFDYVFPGDETFHVLEGAVRISLASGETIELKPGNIASFSKGQSSTWTIHAPLKKFFVISV